MSLQRLLLLTPRGISCPVSGRGDMVQVACHVTTMEPGSAKAAGNLAASSGAAPEPELLETLISTPSLSYVFYHLDCL